MSHLNSTNVFSFLWHDRKKNYCTTKVYIVRIYYIHHCASEHFARPLAWATLIIIVNVCMHMHWTFSWSCTTCGIRTGPHHPHNIIRWRIAVVNLINISFVRSKTCMSCMCICDRQAIFGKVFFSHNFPCNTSHAAPQYIYNLALHLCLYVCVESERCCFWVFIMNMICKISLPTNDEWKQQKTDVLIKYLSQIWPQLACAVRAKL